MQVRRVTALRKLQITNEEARQLYKAERIALEKKYAEIYAPLLEKRVKLISGEVAPELTEEEEAQIPEDVRYMIYTNVVLRNNRIER